MASVGSISFSSLRTAPLGKREKLRRSESGWNVFVR